MKVTKQVASNENQDIILSGYVSSWNEDVNLQTFVSELRSVENDEADVYINSGGGSVYEGIAIANYMQSSSKNINTHIIGFAGSIASIIAISGAKTSISEGSFFFIHDASTGVWGESKDLRKAADELDSINTTLTELYLGVIAANGKLINGNKVKTRNQIKKWQKEETYFTAKEAVDHGFIQELRDFAPDSMQQAAAKTSLEVLNKIKAPKEVIQNYKNAPLKMDGNKNNKEKEAISALGKVFAFFNGSGESKPPQPNAEVEKEAGEAPKDEGSNEIATALADITKELKQLKEANTKQAEEIQALKGDLVLAKAAPLTGDGLNKAAQDSYASAIDKLSAKMFPESK